MASRADISDLGSRIGLDDIILEVMTVAREHPEDYTEILATLRRAREAYVFAVDEPADCDGVAEALEEAADEILAKGGHSNAEGHFRLLALELRLAAQDFSNASSR